MRKQLLILLLISLNVIVLADTKYEATWESIQKHPYPQWFKDAKLGIFIHWGLPSVPAFSGPEQYSEWFLRGLQTGDSLRINFQKRVFGENFTYRDYAPLFKAELFNPDNWADLFKKAGAKYIIFVAKHHDGYCLWPSKYAPNWNSVDVGPKRNIVGELATAIRKKDIRLGLYYSLPEWNNSLHRWCTDPHRNIGKYVDEHMVPQFKELIGKYKPSLIFSDGEWWNTADEWKAKELISWYYNLVGKDAIVNNRWGSGSDVGFLTPEYSAGITSVDRPWAQCRGLGRSFALNRNEPITNYMSPKELIDLFVTAVGSGGGMTINVGPKADGQIPLLQQERLLQLGAWIKINNEAIYGSTAYAKKHGEFKTVKVNRIDKTIDFNWVRNSPDKLISVDDFKATWSGFIKPSSTTLYKFEAKADDGVRVWINNKLVINKWDETKTAAAGNNMGSDMSTVKDGEIKLEANKKYAIKVEYFEGKHGAQIQLFWSSKNIDKQIIPQNNLFTSKKESKGNGLNVLYTSQKQWLSYTKNKGNLYAIALEWPNKDLILDLDIKNVKNLKVELLGYKGKLEYSYKNGQLTVLTSKIKFNQMPSYYAWTFKISTK